MELDDFVFHVLKQIKDGLNEARKEGIQCEYPDIVEFEVGTLAFGEDERLEASIRVCLESDSKLRFIVPFILERNE